MAVCLSSNAALPLAVVEAAAWLVVANFRETLEPLRTEEGIERILDDNRNGRQECRMVVS